MDPLNTVVILLLSIITIIYGYFEYKYRYWKARGIRFDKPTIPYGNLKGAGKTLHLYQIMKKIYDHHKMSGAKLCGAYYFVKPVAILLDLDLIKSVLIKDFSNFDERNTYYNEVDDPISANLFSLDGEKWRKLRGKLSPTFTSGKMKFMCLTMVEVGAKLHDCLLKMVQQTNQVEVRYLCSRFTVDIIGTCAFGIQCNTLEDPNSEFQKYLNKASRQPKQSVIVQLLTKSFKDTARKLHVKKFADDVSEFFTNLVHETVEYREKNKVNRNDFLDILIKLKNSPDKDKAITMNELAAQLFVFFLAGFDTTSAALTFCLYELSLNPKMQAHARRVIQEAYKKHNERFTYEMLMDMPYIDQIFEETLRKHSTGSYLTREAKKDYHVSGSNIVIEKGTTVVIPVHSIHHDPEYYPNPETFDPSRFDIDEKKKRHPSAWLPFGDGPRNCIGLRFGSLKFKVGLVTLLKSFEFTAPPNMTVPIAIDVKASGYVPKDGLNLNVKPLES